MYTNHKNKSKYFPIIVNLTNTIIYIVSRAITRNIRNKKSNFHLFNISN